MRLMKPILAAALMSADVTTTTAADKAPALAYPKAHTVEQVDDYFGTKVSDPYRWMEDVDSAEVKTWVDAENELTQSYLAQVPERAKMHTRLMELTNFERYTAPERRGTRYFYAHNEGLQNQNVLYWQEGLTGERKVLLDPNTMSSDGTVAISGISISDDGRLAAYSIADAGSDWVKWHVRDVSTGKDLPEVQWGRVAEGWQRLLLRGLRRSEKRVQGRCAEGRELLPQGLLP
jgi:prolyl oligopeptidase